jgi:hypothetical protein
LPAQSFLGDSRPYLTVSDFRLLFSSSPTTDTVTVEVFDPASTRGYSTPKSKSVLCYDRRSAGQSLIQLVTTLYSSLLHTHTHTHTLVSRVTSSLTLLGSGFQRRTFRFLWVPDQSPASAPSFSHQQLTTTELHWSQSQSYVMTRGLTPISLSWRQGP